MSFVRVFPPLFFFCLLLCISLCTSLSISLNAYSAAVINHHEENAYELELLISGLQIPWGMAFLSSGEMIFTQRNGQIGIIHLESRKISWLKNLPAIYHKGQAGLLDVAVSPD